MMRTISTIFTGLALALTACAPQPVGTSVDALLHKHAEARGGAEAIKAVMSVELEAEIIEPEFTVTGRYFATRKGYMRVDIFADGGRVFTEALGPEGGWQMFGDGTVEDLSPGGAEALGRGVAGNLYGLHELAQLGYNLDLIGKTERNGRLLWELTQRAPDGFTEHLYIDPDSFLIVSDVETSALHPDIDPTETRQETFHTDYRETAGVLFSEKTQKRNIDTGEIMQTVQIKSRRINGPIDSAHFARPSSAD